MRGKIQGTSNLIETSCILPLCLDVVLLLIVENNNANRMAYAVQAIDLPCC
jgi:predicted HAD superfamily phosphohydrolase YqeG